MFSTLGSSSNSLQSKQSYIHVGKLYLIIGHLTTNMPFLIYNNDNKICKMLISSCDHINCDGRGDDDNNDYNNYDSDGNNESGVRIDKNSKVPMALNFRKLRAIFSNLGTLHNLF